MSPHAPVLLYARHLPDGQREPGPIRCRHRPVRADRTLQHGTLRSPKRSQRTIPTGSVSSVTFVAVLSTAYCLLTTFLRYFPSTYSSISRRKASDNSSYVPRSVATCAPSM